MPHAIGAEKVVFVFYRFCDFSEVCYFGFTFVLFQMPPPTPWIDKKCLLESDNHHSGEYKREMTLINSLWRFFWWNKLRTDIDLSICIISSRFIFNIFGNSFLVSGLITGERSHKNATKCPKELRTMQTVKECSKYISHKDDHFL